jgi:hypothetical protein
VITNKLDNIWYADQFSKNSLHNFYNN